MSLTQNKTHKKFVWNIEYLVIAIYFISFFVLALSLLLKQTLGNPPDETNRYLIPTYILEHGTLPNGYDESIRIYGYGFSYAFQPILPYIIQSFAMRFVSLFTDSADVLFYTARCVNLVFGLITALFVLLLSKKWFTDKRLQYLFAFLVTFLPQSVFMHTYVNTDSCCLMSIAIMLYGLTRGLKENFPYSSCIFLSVGIILCAMSYYNAYGFILSCILLFVAHFLSYKSNTLHFDWKPFLKKGIFISVIVLLGISWWFIRSYILYDGDFLGLKAREICGSMYATPDQHPDTKITYLNQGYSIWGMLKESNFFTLSISSFIGIFGPMTLVTSIWIYRFYKLLFPAGILLCAILNRKKKPFEGSMYSDRPVFAAFYHCNMVFCILMPIFLCIYYSYATDYQPQGRYMLPLLIPFCYYCVRGIQKANMLFTELLGKIFSKKPAITSVWNRCFTGFCVLLCFLFVLFLAITIYGYAFPFYDSMP